TPLEFPLCTTRIFGLLLAGRGFSVPENPLWWSAASNGAHHPACVNYPLPVTGGATGNGFESRGLWRGRRYPRPHPPTLARILAIPGVERLGFGVATIVHVDGRREVERGVLVPAPERVRVNVITLARNDGIRNELGHDLQRVSLLVTDASKPARGRNVIR